MTIPPEPSLNGRAAHYPTPPAGQPTLEEYLQRVRASAHIPNPTLGDLRAYQQWTGLLAGLVVSLLDTHPQIRASVEAHARQWGWQG